MLRRWAGIVIAFVVLSGAGPLLAQAGQAPVEITMWSHWLVEPTKAAWIKEVVQQYEQAHSGVKVNLVPFGDKADLYTQLRALNQAGGKGAPDIHTLDVRPLYAIPWERSGWLLNLKGKLDESHWDKSLLGMVSYNNGIWGIPVEASGLFLWYDKRLAAKLGLEIPKNGIVTLAQFDAMAQKAKAAGLHPLMAGFQNSDVYASFWPVGLLISCAGGQKTLDTIAPWLKKSPYNEPEFVRCLEQAVSTIPKYYNPDAATLTTMESWQRLAAGKALFSADGSWLPGRVNQAIEQGGAPKGFQFGALRFPTVPGGKGEGVVQWGAGTGYGISAFTKHPDVAVDIFNFMSTRQRAARWLELTEVPTGMLPDMGAKLPDILRTQIEYCTDGPVLSPPIYQAPVGDEEVAWRKGLARFYSDTRFTAKAFLDELQRLRAKVK
jgi:ABC-type glycerol-3-phosphate transport system substrate-binding protein